MHWYRLDDLLNGTMKLQIACKVEVHRIAGEDHDEYQVTYTGEGAYDLTAVYVDHIHKVIDWYGLIDGTAIPQLKMEDIGTGTYSGGGDVTLEYTTTLK